jgi:signal transduction histidine kinase
LAALRALAAPATWLATTHLILGPIIGLLTVVSLLLVTVASLGRAVGQVARGALVVQRSRFWVFLGVRMTPESCLEAGPPGARRIGRGRSAPDTGRILAYHLLSAGISAAFALVTVALWTGGLVLGTSALQPHFLRWLIDPCPVRVTIVATVAGTMLLLVAPWVVGRLAAVEVAVARAVLDPMSKTDLNRRVVSLTASREEVIAAADAERRRIERDLHDGTQQRLVSLAMRLGLARSSAGELPSPARRELEHAHEEAKQALVELRDLVRGLHPAVLDDLGLDAALSGIVARCPIPVELQTDLARRLPTRIETVAYFVVSEALTNIAKHAAAELARVSVRLVGSGAEPERLILRISDDGRGGARLDTGGGLCGLQQRVGSVDGTFQLDSPPGGPTTIQVELPCVS